MFDPFAGAEGRAKLEQIRLESGEAAAQEALEQRRKRRAVAERSRMNRAQRRAADRARREKS